ncbi:hypothetical protein As57867_013411, partial [Aphanomyces stellatus]
MAKRRVLTLEEKSLLVKCYDYLKSHPPPGNTGPQFTLRQRVAQCLGFSESTVGRTMASFNKTKDMSFMEKPVKRGHRPRSIAEYFVTELHELIMQANKDCTMVSAKTLCGDLKQLYGANIAVRTMRRVLNRLGYRHQKGRGRYYLAESEANVAFRGHYLRKKLANRDRRNNPVQPEVFLDESYCN